MSPTESNDASLAAQEPDSAGRLSVRKELQVLKKGVRRWEQLSALGVALWISAAFFMSLGWFLRTRTFASVGWLEDLLQGLNPERSIWLVPIGSALLVERMLISPVRALREGRFNLLGALRLIAWLATLVVSSMALLPASGLHLLEWRFFWISHFYLLGLVFPLAAVVGCTWRTQTSDEGLSNGESDSQRLNRSKGRTLGLVAATVSASLLIFTRHAQAQCPRCDGTGVVSYELRLPGISHSFEDVRSIRDAVSHRSGVMLLLRRDSPVARGDNTSGGCLSCGGSGEREADLIRRGLHELVKRLHTDDAEAQFQFALVLDKSHFSGFWHFSPAAWREELDSPLFLGTYAYLRKAALQGHQDAAYHFGMSTNYKGKREHPFELDWLLDAAQGGHVMAQDAIALSLYRGVGGSDKDTVEGLKWMKRASGATPEVPQALYDMGWIYLKGSGTPKDALSAVDLFRRAALLGHSASMRWLAICYEEGLGVEADSTWAYAWNVMAVVFSEEKETVWMHRNGAEDRLWELPMWKLERLVERWEGAMTEEERERTREQTWELWEQLRKLKIKRDAFGDILPVHPL